MSLVKRLRLEAKNNNVTTTSNDMPAFKSTGKACLDFFALGGAFRKRSDTDVMKLFKDAYNEDPILAIKILAYLRDPRGGIGERRFFRLCLPLIASQVKLSLVPEIGRWDDLLTLVDTPLQSEVFTIIAQGLKSENGLCAKWMPRKGRVSRLLREHLKLYPYAYRKLLVGMTNVVETQMCSRNWGEINYEHVPSKANMLYNAAFLKHDEERRRNFLSDVKSGKAKINASVATPHEIVMMMLKGGTAHTREGEPLNVTRNETANLLWKNLPNVVNPKIRAIAVADVSGSMARPHSPDDLPIMISISMALYLSERLEGPFKNAFITFSKTPTLQYTEGDLYNRLCSIRAHHPANTNIEAVFNLVLSTAVEHKLPEEELPTDIVIISDMEFDKAMAYPKDGVFALIRKQYADAGYDMPNICFWNVNARKNHQPVSRDARGVTLISGASQNAIVPVMKGAMNPTIAMLNAVDKSLYSNFANEGSK